MTEQLPQGVSTQLLVPAYVWSDKAQREAALIKVGGELATIGAGMRENIDHANATVHPHGLKAGVARVDVGKSEPVAFVGYDLCDVEHADLVMIVVTALVVPS
jgi:hypothetical protein